MGFIHGFKIGQQVTQTEIAEVFNHNIMSGMKYSSTTNTMVLVNDLSDTLYYNRWENDVFYYTGSGIEGNQELTSRNKRLGNANVEGTKIYLMEGIKGKSFVFMGQFKLASNPFQEEQYDINGNLRKVWIFPLIPLENQRNFPLPDNLLVNAEKEKIKITRKISDSELTKRAKIVKTSSAKRKTISTTFERDPIVSEFAKRWSKGICQLCEKPAPYKNNKGEPHLHTHHIEWLSHRGEDSIYNTIALCPNCHDKMHVLDLQEDVNKLKAKIKVMKAYW